jgi:hypothetical protein
MKELILIGVISVVFIIKIVRLEKRIKKLEDENW